MAEESTEQEEIHSEGKKRWEDWYAANYRVNEDAMSDRLFVCQHGEQYQGSLEDEYEDRPKPEINKCKMAQRRLNSEYRKHPITADFISKTGDIDKDLASQLDGAYRSDEQDYGGQEAYDACADEAHAGGKGAYRLRAVREDEFDPFNDHQRIAFDYIPDADVSVGFDMNSKRQDKSDAGWGGIVQALTREAYEEEYGDENTASWPVSMNTEFWHWHTPDYIYVFEYYRVEIGSRKLLVFDPPEEDGEEVRIFEDEIEEDPDKELMLISTGHVRNESRDRNIKVREVYKYIMSGQRILDGPTRIPGNIIPIAIQYGERYIIGGIERFNGFVRTLRDAQMIYNMLIGMLAEIAVDGTKELPIFAPDQITTVIANHWADANRKKYAYMLAEPLYDASGNLVSAGPMAYTKAPEVPPALAALINVVGLDIKELLGEGMSQDEIVSNISGKAVDLIQKSNEIPHFIFVDNGRKCRKRGGEIWLAMAKEIYVENGRKLRTVTAEQKIGEVTIGAPRFNDNGVIISEFDISDSRLGIYAGVGPSSASQKAATSRELLGAYQTAPPGSEESMVLLAGAMYNMEGAGIEQMRPYWRNKLIQFGALERNKEEQEEFDEAQKQQANAEPDANEQLLLSAAQEAQAKAEEALAKVKKIQAETLKTVAQIGEIEANTAETVAGIGRDDQSAEVKAIEVFGRQATTQPA